MFKRPLMPRDQYEIRVQAMLMTIGLPDHMAADISFKDNAFGQVLEKAYADNVPPEQLALLVVETGIEVLACFRKREAE